MAFTEITSIVSAIATILEKGKVIQKSWQKLLPSNLFVIYVDNLGNLSQPAYEFEIIMTQALAKAYKQKEVNLKIINPSLEKQFNHNKTGIDNKIWEPLDANFDLITSTLKLLIKMRANGYLYNFSDAEFIIMSKNILRYSVNTPVIDPFLTRLDIFFTPNISFRTTIEFTGEEIDKLFQELGVSHLFQIFGGKISELPHEVVYSKVIPAITHTLEKYSDQALYWHNTEYFDFGLWEYGVA